ncbi:Magnesium transport protein CorA [Candidatus Fokinia solitaria]|uniref:Magnesium transport protein CorA n=1 Tax=Candidatus Fokinia solitaria TaxID=1802984 RepID=A0A2U8BSK8_9RICK|nr:CorA family divalent cation transporter [Candidatus Fokinia solitaria]AWD33317.1 Magnesium transport protein CorA [Candidatus Fokinia solitaria]
MPIIAIKKNFNTKGEFYSIADDIRDIDKSSIFVDITSPSDEEVRIISKLFSLYIPTEEEMEIREVKTPFEVKSSFEVKASADKKSETYHMTITALQGTSESFESFALTLTLTSECLILIKHDNAPLLESFIKRMVLREFPESTLSPELLLLSVIEFIVGNVATILEAGGNEIDSILQMLFEDVAKTKIKDRYKEALHKIGRSAQLISKSRESLMSIHRMIIYYSQTRYILQKNKEHRLRFNKISGEINSLNEYSNFLSQRNSFLFDAALGVISVEQSAITKLFTIASAVFMPPTLIASIYGMNFEFLPALTWEFGYWIAFVAMLISSSIPLIYFKRKGWI